MFQFPIDSNILLALELLENKGFEAYIVGGAVRDFILDEPAHDYDLATSATLEEAEEIFCEYKTKRYIGKGITLGVVINHTHFELSRFKGATIEEDLKNRDFSINSMAIDKASNIIDPHGCLIDLGHHVLKTVREPHDVLKEDPIRILRALRFMVTKKMTIDEKLKEAIKDCSPFLKNAAHERFRHEMDPILTSEIPSKVFVEYPFVFFELIPKLKDLYGFDQKNKKWHTLDAYMHTMKVLDSTKNILELRWAALLHDIAKVDCFTQDEQGIGHFYGHAAKSSEYAEEILAYFCYHHVFISRVSKIIYYHDREFSLTQKNILSFLYTFGTKDLDLYFGLRRADILGQNPALYDRIYFIDDVAALAKRCIDEEKIITYKNLRINGNDLVELGYEKEEIGFALEHILLKVIKGQLKNDPKKLYMYACELKFHMHDEQ